MINTWQIILALDIIPHSKMRWYFRLLGSISPTLYGRVFCTNVVFSSYIRLDAKILYEKCAHIMLMKSTTVVNFINVKFTNFSYECRFGSFSLVTCLVTFCFGEKFVQKTCAYNVDEIDGWAMLFHMAVQW